MRQFFPTLALVSGVWVAACFPSLEGLTGARDGSVSDATSDAFAPREDAANQVVDAGVDAPFEGGPFCATNVPANTFCSDFDLNDLTVFANKTEVSGGTVVLDKGDAALSPPGSLITTIPSRPVAEAGAFSMAYVHYVSSPAQSSIGEISFSIRAEKVSSDRSTSLAVLQFVGPDRNYEARVSLNPDRTVFVSELDTKTSVYAEPFRTPNALSVDTWHRIRFRVEMLAVNSGRADLEIDGVAAVTALAMKPVLTSGNLRTSVGNPFVRAPNDSWRLRYDDLLIFPK